MALAPGTRLGPYEIVAAIGAGGMGEVYRARDTRLGRDVAIKVVAPAFAANPERLRRFEQEARAVAALNHPNVLAIYDIGRHSDGSPYLVSELLEGQTLRAALGAGAMPTRKAAEYGAQIARGLAEAHEKDIVHRDLKPENVFLTRDGRVKILDFGLARLEPKDAAEAETRGDSEAVLTRSGMVMGTVGYMSPEQVRGRAADARSDIFSFGAILYEMLTGRRAFRRDTAAETMTAILKEEPPPAPDLSSPFERLILHCLEKDTEHRFRSAHDLAFALETFSGATTATQPLAVAGPGPAHITARAVAAIAVVLLLAAAATLWRLWPAGAAPEWTGVRLGGPDIAMSPKISPDGHTVAFQVLVDGQNQLGVMNVDSGAWNVLTSDRTRGQLYKISWSPDGAKIYFDRFDAVPRGVFSIPPVGGEERLVLEDAMIPEALPDGSLVVTRVNAQRDYQLYRYRPDSGRVDPLPAVLAQVGPGPYPMVSAFRDGKEVAFFGGPLQAGSLAKPQFHVLDLAGGRLRHLPTQKSIDESGLVYGLAADPQGRYIATISKSGDLYRVVAIPRDGSGAERILLLLTTNSVWNLDLGADGSMYVDQGDRPIDVLRFPATGGTPERVAGAISAGAFPYPYALRLADGRTLFTSVIAGRLSVLIAKPGKTPVPLVETETTSGPLALLNNEEVALLADSGAEQVVAIVSLRDGRIVRRLEATRGMDLVYFSGLSASADGKTLYYSASGHLWSIAAAGGQARKIRPADSVALDSNSGDLILQLNETAGTRFVRFSPTTEKEAPIPFHSPLRAAPAVLSSRAVGKDGRMVISVSSPDSWFLSAAVLDPRTGKVDRVPLKFEGDIFVPGWAPDGSIVTQGWRLQSMLWRFRK